MSKNNNNGGASKPPAPKPPSVRNVKGSEPKINIGTVIRSQVPKLDKKGQ